MPIGRDPYWTQKDSHPLLCILVGEVVAMLSIRLPEEIDARLARLAKEAGLTKSEYAREAILEKIEHLEDLHLAEQVLERVRKGKEKTVSSEEMWRELED